MKELQVMYKAGGKSLWMGTLGDDGREILFQYSPEALASGIDFSPMRLPLRPEAYPDKQADYLNLMRLPGVIYDSLPDGWGLQLMERRLRAEGIDTSTISVLDRLAYLGDNTMGALTYEPGATTPLEGRDLTIIEMASEIRVLLQDESHAVLAELARAGGSPGGARPKAVAFYDPNTEEMSTYEGRVPGARSWLFKFPSKEDTMDSCAMEGVYARMSDRVGLGMASSKFIQLPNGLTAFGTKRFDRDEAGQRVHVHSLAGLLHTDFRLPTLGYVEFMQVTRRLTRDHREVVKALQRCVFNVIMNNRDDHSRNLAFMLNGDNEWVLAPPYDLTYAPGFRGEHFMDVGGEGFAPSRAHILKVARAGGLKDAEAEAIIDSMLNALTVEAFQHEAGQLPVSSQSVNTVVKAIKGNRSRLGK